MFSSIHSAVCHVLWRRLGFTSDGGVDRSWVSMRMTTGDPFTFGEDPYLKAVLF